MSKDDKVYSISDDLLDILCLNYLQAQGTIHASRDKLLTLPPEEVKSNMAIAHGYGKMMNLIISHIPNSEERMYGRDIRRSTWLSIKGTECRGDRGRKGTGEKAKGGSSNPTGSKSILPKRCS